MKVDTASLTSSLQDLITAAQTEASTTGASNDAQSAALELEAAARAIIALLSRPGASAPVRSVTVGQGARGAESIFQIAQDTLGDPLRFQELLDANGLAFIALQPGQVLLLPAG